MLVYLIIFKGGLFVNELFLNETEKRYISKFIRIFFELHHKEITKNFIILIWFFF